MHPEYQQPVRNTEDIPIQRDSVGGMTMNTVDLPFKPYVYRGTGEDQIEMTAWLRAEAQRTEAEHWRQEVSAARQRAIRQRREAREREAEHQAIEAVPRLIAQMHAGIERALEEAASPDFAIALAAAREAQALLAEADAPAPEPRSPARPAPRRGIGPSRG